MSRPARHDLEVLVTRAAEVCGPAAADKGVDLRRSFDGPIDLRCDAARLRRALSALVDHAIRLTPVGGAVSVRGWAEEDVVHLEVADTGVGVPPEDLPHLFDPGAAGGEQGLAFAREVAEAHGGTLSVRSAPGEGTIIALALPRD